MTDEAVMAMADRIEAQAAEIERLAEDKRWIIDERDRTFAMMLSRAEEAEAEIERLRGAVEKRRETRMSDDDLIRRCDVFEILDNEGSLGRTRKLVEQLVVVTTEAQAAEIKRLRGDLKKAQGALHQIAGKKDYADDPWDIARATLAELTGAQKDGH